MLKKHKHLPWPLNLWSTVFRQPMVAEDLPDNWQAVLTHVLKTLPTQRKREVLLYYFRDDMTLQEIGNIYGTAGEPVRQHAEKAIRMLRHPSRQTLMAFGWRDGGEAMEKDRAAADASIASLNLGIRSYNCLRRAGIETVEQLIVHTEAELSKLRNMGAKSLQEIKDCLSARGLSLCNSDTTTEEMGEKRVCCNCGNNIRVAGAVEPYIDCHCAIDGHRIGYVECFEHSCRHWTRDCSWDNKEGETQ